MSRLVYIAIAALLPAAWMPAPPAEAQAPPSHEAFTRLLADVVESPLVDYRTLMAQRETLDRYIEALGATDSGQLESNPEDDRLAFWINAYNACMLLRVANHYPIESGGTGLFGSLRNLAAGRPDNSVWQIPDVFGEEFCPVAGEARSLDQIEHEIIRPRFGDPRIHFAVNCAAVSCPQLAAEAYVGARLDEQLDRQVRAFIQDERHFALELSSPPVLRLNKVLDWYAVDFGGQGGLAGLFAPYVEPRERATLEDPGLRIEFFEYDWTLNDIHADRGS